MEIRKINAVARDAIRYATTDLGTLAAEYAADAERLDRINTPLLAADYREIAQHIKAVAVHQDGGHEGIKFDFCQRCSEVLA